MTKIQTKQMSIEAEEVLVKGKRFEIVKSGPQAWNYEVFLDGKKVENVISASIDIGCGEAPRCWLEVLDI